MPKPEESSFELPPKPPVFGVTDESPEPGDIIQPSSKTPGDISSTEKATTSPASEAAASKKTEKGKESNKKSGPKKPAPPPPMPPAEPSPEPPAPKAARVEKLKTPEKALSAYFKKVENGTDFLQRIIAMPDSNQLQRSIPFAELERLSGELSQKVIDFFYLIETWEKDKKSGREMAKSEEEFIASHTIPSGCQTAFRTVALFAINKILGPVADTPHTSQETTPSAPPTPPPPPSPPVAGSGEAGKASESRFRRLSASELAESQRRKEASERAAKTGAVSGRAITPPTSVPSGETPPPMSAPESTGYRSRLWNPKPKSASETVPPVPPVPKAAEAAEKAPETRAAAGLTPEKIRALTFENLADLSDDELRAVVRASLTTAFGWGFSMRYVSDAFSSRVRGAVDSAIAFDSGVKTQLEANETVEQLKMRREDAVNSAREALWKAFTTLDSS